MAVLFIYIGRMPNLAPTRYNAYPLLSLMITLGYHQDNNTKLIK